MLSSPAHLNAELSAAARGLGLTGARPFLRTDVLVIGGGIAGCAAALSRRRGRCIGVAARPRRRWTESNTAWAQGGVAASHPRPGQPRSPCGRHAARRRRTSSDRRRRRGDHRRERARSSAWLQSHRHRRVRPRRRRRAAAVARGWSLRGPRRAPRRRHRPGHPAGHRAQDRGAPSNHLPNRSAFVRDLLAAGRTVRRRHRPRR